MGTPRFAVPSLKSLAQSRHQIIAVVTNPDRPQGRGRQLASPPVKEQALKLGLEVLQPTAVKDPALAATLAARMPDLFIVVAFSILPRHLLAIPRLGSINLHPSLLPAYRGAAPIIWAVANGEKETGITTFQLSPRMDAGHILLQRRFAIGCDETAGELEARLCVEGTKMVVETVDGLEEGRFTGRPQGTDGISRAPKLTKEDGLIDWHQPAEQIRNLVRGMNPAPRCLYPMAGQNAQNTPDPARCGQRRTRHRTLRRWSSRFNRGLRRRCSTTDPSTTGGQSRHGRNGLCAGLPDCGWHAAGLACSSPCSRGDRPVPQRQQPIRLALTPCLRRMVRSCGPPCCPAGASSTMAAPSRGYSSVLLARQPSPRSWSSTAASVPRPRPKNTKTAPPAATVACSISRSRSPWPPSTPMSMPTSRTLVPCSPASVLGPRCK